MKFDICEVFTQKDENEIEKFLLEKIRNVPDEATLSDVSMVLHNIVVNIMSEYDINHIVDDIKKKEERIRNTSKI